METRANCEGGGELATVEVLTNPPAGQCCVTFTIASAVNTINPTVTLTDSEGNQEVYNVNPVNGKVTICFDPVEWPESFILELRHSNLPFVRGCERFDDSNPAGC